MQKELKAVIFDMDGVLIDSEPLWRQSMISGFNDFSMSFTEEECRITTGMRLKEVVEYWVKKRNEDNKKINQIHDRIIYLLIEAIIKDGKAMNGVYEALEYIKDKSYKIGLATSSNNVIVDTVLQKLAIRNYFHTITSAEYLTYAKPHPEVFLKCAQDLGVNPQDCIVIEDSVNGIIAAKSACMKVIAIPDKENRNNPKFTVADYQYSSLNNTLQLL